MDTHDNIVNQFQFFEERNKTIMEHALLQLKNEYEKKDKEIFNASWRKKNGYIPHGTRRRTLITLFGNVTYNRHRYRIWDTNSYRFVYLSDIALGIEKYQRMTKHLEIKIMALIAQGKRYQDILDCFPNIKLGTYTVANIIRRTKINSLEDMIKKYSIPVKINQCLYINVDDTFLTLRENNKKTQFRIRVVLFHDGYDLENSTMQKKVLKNVRCFTKIVKQNSENIETKDFMKNIYDLAKSLYTNVDDVDVLISGDGAPWIRKCSDYWPKSIYILDKFHAIRKLRQLFNPSNKELKPIYDSAKFLFTQGKYEQLINLLNQKYFQDDNKIRKQLTIKSYFEKNEININGVSNQNHVFNIGCNIESTISHHVKWLLGYGSKAFSKDVYSKILDVHIAKVNGINFIDLLKESYFAELKRKKDYYRHSFWNNKPQITNYEICKNSVSNLPNVIRNSTNNFIVAN